MIDLKNLQKEIYQNKVDKGFNVTDVNKEFCLTYGEVAEAYEAWRKKKDDLGEELADVAIYLLFSLLLYLPYNLLFLLSAIFCSYIINFFCIIFFKFY